MKKINPYFLTGMLGILLTSILQILESAFLNDGTASFSFLYPVFIIFLLIGTAVMIKKKQRLEE